MAQSSPEGIVLGKGSTLVSAEVSINEEKVLDGLTMGQILENEKTIEEPKPFKNMLPLTKVDWEKFKKNPIPSKKEEPKQELSARLKNSLIQFNINLDEAFDLPDWKLKTIGFSNRSILELKNLKEEPKQFKGRGMLHYSGKIIGGEPKQENTAEYIDRHIVEAMVEVAKQKMYSEEEVEDLIYKVCGTVARLQGITLNGNHIDTAYKQFKKK